MLKNRGVKQHMDGQHMDGQGAAVESPHVVRMLLLILGAVLGLLVLGTLFGSSSASADDGHGSDEQGSASSLLGGVVSAVTDTVAAPVHQAGTAVSHAVAPVSHAIAPVARPVAAAVDQLPVAEPVADAVNGIAESPASSITDPVASVADHIVQRLVGATPLGPVIGPQPVASVLDPVAELLDGTVVHVTGPALPVGLPSALAASAAPAVVEPAIAAVVGAVTARDSEISGDALGLLDTVPAGSGDEFISSASASGAMATALAVLMAPVLLVWRRALLHDRAAPGSPVYDTDSSPD